MGVPDLATRPARSPAATTRLALLAAVVSGAGVAVQSRVNGELALELGDALVAALVNFLVGLTVVSLAVALRPAARRALPALRRTRPFERIGGLGGASLVAASAAAAPELGVALLTVGLVAGQTAGALVVDKVGLGPGGPRTLTGPRLAGATLCLLAVGISAAGAGAREARPLLLAAVIGAGVLVSVQQALNGRVRATTGDAGVATLMNFVGGTAALAVGVGIHAAVSGIDVGPLPGPSQAYLYLGGPLGAGFVAVAAVVVRRLGVLRLGLAVVAGQLVGAVLLDVVLPTGDSTLDGLTVVGAALTLVAVAITGRGQRAVPA